MAQKILKFLKILSLYIVQSFLNFRVSSTKSLINLFLIKSTRCGCCWNESSNMAEVAHAIITVRVIRSFEYKNIHNIVYHDVDLNTSTATFMSSIIEGKKATVFTIDGQGHRKALEMSSLLTR